MTLALKQERNLQYCVLFLFTLVFSKRISTRTASDGHGHVHQMLTITIALGAWMTSAILRSVVYKWRDRRTDRVRRRSPRIYTMLLPVCLLRT